MKIIYKTFSVYGLVFASSIFLGFYPTGANAEVSAEKNQNTQHDALSEFSFENAMNESLNNSQTVKSSEYLSQAEQLRSDAIRYINTPKISLSGQASRYRYYNEFDTSDMRNKLNQFGQSLDQSFKAVSGGNFPDVYGKMGDQLFPNPYEYDEVKNNVGVAVNLVWPLYTGGRTSALKALSQSKIEQSNSDLMEAQQHLYTLTAERYYGTQLAMLVLNAHDDALNTIKQHDYKAKRFYEKGVIDKHTRLKAQVALADAEQSVESARSRLRLAQSGLKQLVGHTRPPSSLLFVNTHGLKPVEYYQDKALEFFVGFSKLDAKKKQVEAARSLSRAALKPTVNVFGRHEIKKDHPDWIIGINVSYTLWSNVNRLKMIKAASLQQASIDVMQAQVRSDVRLLIEKHWLETQDAISRFNSHSSKLSLALEGAKLQRKGFDQGVKTALEAIDAETELAKVRTERAIAAYDYIMALARLLEVSGVPKELTDYEQRADVYINEVGKL